MKKIEIMGCGYIGLPTAITFTLAGYEVCGFDVKDSSRRDAERGPYPYRRTRSAGCHDEGHEYRPSALHHEAGACRRLHHLPSRPPTARRRRTTSACPTCASSKPRQRRSAAVLQAGNLCVLESTSPPYSTRMVEQDRLRDLRPCARAVHDGALPRAHHPRPHAHRAARE